MPFPHTHARKVRCASKRAHTQLSFDCLRNLLFLRFSWCCARFIFVWLANASGKAPCSLIAATTGPFLLLTVPTMMGTCHRSIQSFQLLFASMLKKGNGRAFKKENWSGEVFHSWTIYDRKNFSAGPLLPSDGVLFMPLRQLGKKDLASITRLAFVVCASMDQS